MTITTNTCKPPHSRRLTKDERSEGNGPSVAALLLVLVAVASLLAGLAAPGPAWVRMWLLCGGLFLMAKAAVLPERDRAAFVVLWPGMDAAAFGRKATSRLPLSLRGWANFAAGVVLIWCLARLPGDPFVGTWVAMAGFILALHCGLFTLLAAFWRGRGRDVMPLMEAPLLAGSVTEFWGRRWNHAFRDLAHAVLFKPVARRFGALAGTWAVFIASGLAHEMVVTVPAGAGYGGPALYFALQALGLSLERGCPIRWRWVWRLRALAFLILPLPLLFPRPFVMNVCQPFFHTIGALP